ncbi:hypothetical protein [Enterococcus sp. HY326]|uniref:hypothetical protein n=1 Tax=Enterococcus sp. HY326 TaxID=2971265 RepID=UPI00223F7DD1|nr:hypothetical protein [Enterococcus sp. HY326]
MTILEWIVMIGAAGCILFTVFTLLFFFQFLLNRSKLKKIPERAPKNKKKRRRWERIIVSLKELKKKSLVRMVIFLILSMGAGGATFYASFYQSINLTSDDADAIVRSYYLLRDFQQELDKAANQTEDETSSLQNIRYLATSLSSYNTNKASQLNTTEGQSALNRYFNALSKLGVNATRESQNFYGNTELVAQFQEDVERTIGYEMKAFDYYKVNQSALESKESGGQ